MIELEISSFAHASLKSTGCVIVANIFLKISNSYHPHFVWSVPLNMSLFYIYQTVGEERVFVPMWNNDQCVSGVCRVRPLFQ